MSTIANAKVAHNYNRYNGYFFGCLLVSDINLCNKMYEDTANPTPASN